MGEMKKANIQGNSNDSENEFSELQSDKCSGVVRKQIHNRVQKAGG